jgi:hypothetical protein
MLELLITLTLISLTILLFIVCWFHDKSLIKPRIPETESEERCKRIKEKYEWLKSNMVE